MFSGQAATQRETHRLDTGQREESRNEVDPADSMSCVCVCWPVCHLPRYLFNEPLHGDSELAEEAFDDRSAFCKLVLHLDVQDVCHQCYKRVFL